MSGQDVRDLLEGTVFEELNECDREPWIGFASESSERLFELFTQMHKNRDDGDGLGSMLCRGIVHPHLIRVHVA